MTLGPVELVVISVPCDRWDAGVLPELTRLLEAQTLTMIDGLLVMKDEDGVLRLGELGTDGIGSAGTGASRPRQGCDELITADDVDALTADLEPDSAAAILLFEHTWVRGLRDAVCDAGGLLEASTVPVAPDIVAEVITQRS